MAVAKLLGSTQFADQQNLSNYTDDIFGITVVQTPKSMGEPPAGVIVVLYALYGADNGNTCNTYLLEPTGALNTIAVNLTATPEQVYDLVAGNGPTVLAGPLTLAEFNACLELVI
jgi:sulfur relay (sulfurtransferase) DsrF/TusC family protein